MSENEVVKHYESNDGLTVVWKPKKCIHAAECVKRLPQVYNPNAKPWIKVENASAEELKKQIDACPSGALSYISENNNETSEIMETKVDVLANGPLLVHGKLIVKDSKGNEVEKTATTAFCRCGASHNKPYCDGSHAKVDFKAD
jgi:uncharacterized Fe-S cluster protein YjdI